MKNLVRLRKSIMLFVKIMIVAAVTVGFIQVWITKYVESLFSNKGNYVVILSFVLLFTVFSSLYGAFKIGISRIHEIIYSFSLATVFTNAIMYLELSLIAREMVEIQPMLVGIVYQILVVALCSFCANTIYFKLYLPRRVVAIFGDDVSGFELIQKMGKISERFSIERGLNVNTTDLAKIKSQIDKYEAVVICGIDKNLQKQILSYCYTHEKRSYLLPDITDIIVSNSYNIQISDTPVLMSRNRGLTLEQRIIKRAMDIVVSAIAIVVTSPIMLICAIAIKLDDGGPILFKQNRITINGKIFNVLKFRSMIVDADKDGAKKAVSDDDRITRVGRIIRAFRIDELPQLLNILKGDMSIIGPRPPLPREVVLYTPYHMERLLVKGGLSCICQVEGRSDMEFDKWVESDIEYIKKRSLMLDISLLFRTIAVVITGKGAK